MINDQEKFLEEFKSLLKHSVDPDFIDEKKIYRAIPKKSFN